MRLWLAFQSFFKILSDGQFARGVEQLQIASPAEPAPAKTEPAPPPKPPKPSAPRRSEAITLLATLQREARFVDIVTESLDGYSDAQIGAAARDVLRDCGKVVERMFAVEPMTSVGEGQAIEVPKDYDPARFRITGNVSGEPPLSGQVVHAGWRATRCDVPKWTGADDAALVIAPTEVQIG